MQSTNIINTPNLLQQVTDWSGAVVARLGEYEWVTNTVYGTNQVGSTTNIYKVVTTTRRLVPGAFTNALDEITRFTYDGFQQLGSIKTAAGLTTTNLFNSAGFITKSIDLEIKATNTFGYLNGLPAAHTNELGLVRTFTWDALQRLTGIGYPDSTTVSNRYDKLDLVATKDRNGSWTGFRHDSARRLTAVTNANNHVTTFGYCGCGSLESITDPLSQTTTISYDHQLRATNVAFPDNASLSYRYDRLGRLTNVIDSTGYSVFYTHNHQGLLTTVSNAAGKVWSASHDVLDRPTVVTDADGVTVTNTFDVLDRLTARAWQDGGIESFVYTAAGLTNYINPLNQFAEYHRDVAGRLTIFANPNNQVTYFTNDAVGNVVAMLDQDSHVTRWNFDKFGRVTNKFDGLNREVFRLTYDPAGRITNRWTPAKGNTGYALDALGNLKTVTPSNAPSTAISYSYDAAERLTNMTDTVGATKFGYTPTGQLEREDGPWTNDIVTLSYLQGRRSALSLEQPLSAAWSQTYGYDAGRRLQTLISPAGTFAYEYASGAGDLVRRVRLPAGVISNTFDVLGQLTGTTLATGWRAPVSSYGYSYDKWGQRTNITRLFNGGRSTLALGYDFAGQLTSATGRETNGTARLHETFGYEYSGANNVSVFGGC